MHHQTKIIFICHNEVLRDAVLMPLSDEFKTSNIPHDKNITYWTKEGGITEQGYHDIWLIDDGVDNPNTIIAHIMDKYGTMGAKIIMIGEGKDTQYDTIYLEKPLHITTLKKIIRDSQNKGEKYKNPIFLYDNLYIHYAQNKLCRDDVCVDITDKEISLLIYLIQCGEKGAYRDDILWHVWGQKNDLDSHTLETHISAIRSKIEKKFHLDGVIIFEHKTYKINKN